MPRPLRDEILPPDENCFAHLYNRCVQGLYLCGKDYKTGKDYSYRKDWIAQRLEQLASVYLIDIVAFAILENHLHVVVRTLPDEVEKMSDRDVAIRWLSLHPGRMIDDFVCIEPNEVQINELLNDPKKLERIRHDISSCSYFMKDLCEVIAKRANKEEGRTGHFWEDRFKASRLLDALAILVCCAYVDLNPIRAGMAVSLEKSNYTSIQARIQSNNQCLTSSIAFSKVYLSGAESANGISVISEEKLLREIQKAKEGALKNMVPKDAWLAKLSIDVDQCVDPRVSHLNKSGVRASDKGFLEIGLGQYIDILVEALRFKPGNEGLRSSTTEGLKKIETEGTPMENILLMISDYKRVFGNSCRIGNPVTLKKELERTGKSRSRYSRLPTLLYGPDQLTHDPENDYFRKRITNKEASSDTSVTAG